MSSKEDFTLFFARSFSTEITPSFEAEVLVLYLGRLRLLINLER